MTRGAFRAAVVNPKVAAMSAKEWESLRSEGSVVIKRVMEVAVYENTSSDLVIRQRGEDGEDSFVVIPTSHVPAVIEAMRRIACEIDDA